MGWKERPRWVKYGVYGLMLSIIFVLIPEMISSYLQTKGISSIGLFFENYMDLIYYTDYLSFMVCRGICYGFGAIIHIITMWPSWFIAGAFLGLIVDRIKSKK